MSEKQFSISAEATAITIIDTELVLIRSAELVTALTSSDKGGGGAPGRGFEPLPKPPAPPKEPIIKIVIDFGR
jgi:hypothetical protein